MAKQSSLSSSKHHVTALLKIYGVLDSMSTLCMEIWSNENEHKLLETLEQVNFELLSQQTLLLAVLMSKMLPMLLILTWQALLRIMSTELDAQDVPALKEGVTHFLTQKWMAKMPLS